MRYSHLIRLLSFAIPLCVGGFGPTTDQEEIARAQSAVEEDSAFGRNVIIDWNFIAHEMEPSSAFVMPLSRMFAMIHVGMHDAINSIKDRYTTWSPPVPAEPGASVTAAATRAAFVLTTRLVAQSHRPPTTTYDANGNPIAPYGKDLLLALINQTYQAHLAVLTATDAEVVHNHDTIFPVSVQRGLDVGQAAADQIWNLRLNDGAVPGTLAPFTPNAPKSADFFTSWWEPYIIQQQPVPIGVWRMHPSDFGSPTQPGICVTGSYPANFPSYYWWESRDSMGHCVAAFRCAPAARPQPVRPDPRPQCRLQRGSPPKVCMPDGEYACIRLRGFRRPHGRARGRGPMVGHML